MASRREWVQLTDLSCRVLELEASGVLVGRRLSEVIEEFEKLWLELSRLQKQISERR